MLSAGSALKAASRVPNLEAQYANKITSLSVASAVDREGPPLEMTIFRTPNEPGLRGLAKSCLNWLGVRFPEVARHEGLDALRAFVMCGEHHGPVGVYLNMALSLPFTMNIPTHAILLTSVESPPFLLGHVLLFGEIKYTVIMSEAYSGPVISLALIQDPWRRTHEEIAVPHRLVDWSSLPSVDPHSHLHLIDESSARLVREIQIVERWTELHGAIIRGLQAAGVRRGESIPLSAAAPVAAEVSKALCGLSSTQSIPTAEEAARRELECEELLTEAARSAPWINNKTLQGLVPRTPTRQ